MSLAWTDKSLSPFYLAQHGFVIEVEIHHPSRLIDPLTKSGQVVQSPATVQALIDTGATYSAIDKTLATNLGLLEVSQAVIASATGPTPTQVYAASLRFTDSGLAGFDPLPLLGVNLYGFKTPCLIGRDVLSTLLMIYDGKRGQCTIGQ